MQSDSLQSGFAEVYSKSWRSLMQTHAQGLMEVSRSGVAVFGVQTLSQQEHVLSSNFSKGQVSILEQKHLQLPSSKLSYFGKVWQNSFDFSHGHVGNPASGQPPYTGGL